MLFDMRGNRVAFLSMDCLVFCEHIAIPYQFEFAYASFDKDMRGLICHQCRRSEINVFGRMARALHEAKDDGTTLAPSSES